MAPKRLAFIKCLPGNKSGDELSNPWSFPYATREPLMMYKNIIFQSKCFFVNKNIVTHLNVTPPIYVPSKSDVRKTFAAGSVASDGNSCMYVATHVKTAAAPTKLLICQCCKLFFTKTHTIIKTEPVKSSN